MIRIRYGFLRFRIECIFQIFSCIFQSISSLVRSVFLGFLDSCSHFFPCIFIGISFYCPCVSKRNKSYTNSSKLSCFFISIIIIIMYFFGQFSRLGCISIRYIIVERISNSLLDFWEIFREQFNLVYNTEF
jgi:hypothetical protein